MLVITLGDPLSVTVECLWRERAFWAQQPMQTIVLVGSRQLWDAQLGRLKVAGPRLQSLQTWNDLRGPGLYFLDSSPKTKSIDPLRLTLIERGEIAAQALESLRSLHPHGSRLAVLTGPIDKHNCQLAGFNFPGQTEFFEQLWGASGIMILAGPRLRVALVTNHLALRDVPAVITTELVLEKIRRFNSALQNIFGLDQPRLAVAGLNPHCSDGGLFGDEEARIIRPAVQLAQAEGIDVLGPLPADTVFFRAHSGEFAGVLAMYHDQGLGPLKALHFYDAINVTGGLPHLRLSPDHGPAADLYATQTARSDSFRVALLQVRQYLRW